MIPWGARSGQNLDGWSPETGLIVPVGGLDAGEGSTGDLGLDRTNGPVIDDEEIVDIAGLEVALAASNAAASAAIEVVAGLDDPAGVSKHRVDRLTRGLFKKHHCLSGRESKP